MTAISEHRVSTWSGKSGKVREFVRVSEKVRKIRDILERVGKAMEENFYSYNFLTLIKKSYAHRNLFSQIVYENQFYI